MPTAPKLVAALLLAALAYYASELVKGFMPERETFGTLSLVNAGIGFLCGWIVVGSRAGRGTSAAISNGLTGVIAALFWCLGVHAVDEMVERSLDRRYGSMLDAIAGIFELMAEYAALLVDLNFIVTLLVGAIVVGYVTEVVARHWR